MYYSYHYAGHWSCKPGVKNEIFGVIQTPFKVRSSTDLSDMICVLRSELEIPERGIIFITSLSFLHES